MELSNQFDVAIDPDSLSSIFANLNTSSTVSGKIIQSAYEIIETSDENDFTSLFNQLIANITSFTTFMRETYTILLS